MNNTDLKEEDLKIFGKGTEDELNIGGIHYADAVTMGSEEVSDEVMQEFEKKDVTKLPFSSDEDLLVKYAEFVKSFAE